MAIQSLVRGIELCVAGAYPGQINGVDVALAAAIEKVLQKGWTRPGDTGDATVMKTYELAGGHRLCGCLPDFRNDKHPQIRELWVVEWYDRAAQQPVTERIEPLAQLCGGRASRLNVKLRHVTLRLERAVSTAGIFSIDGLHPETTAQRRSTAAKVGAESIVKGPGRRCRGAAVDGRGRQLTHPDAERD
jgi:hypothetical protein